MPDDFSLVDSENYTVFFDLRSLHYPELDDQKKKEILKRIFANALEKKKMILKVISDTNQETLALVLYLVSRNRLIQLAAVRDKDIQDIGFFTLILDRVIQEHAETEKMIDFGGSMMEGVAMYNESFGAKKHLYTKFSNFR